MNFFVEVEELTRSDYFSLVKLKDGFSERELVVQRDCLIRLERGDDLVKITRPLASPFAPPG